MSFLAYPVIPATRYLLPAYAGTSFTGTRFVGTGPGGITPVCRFLLAHE